MINIASLKDHVSRRGIAMTVFAAVVAGLAVATLLHVPTPPDVGPASPDPSRTNAPWIEPATAPRPAIETPSSGAPAPPPIPEPVPTVTPTPIPSPTYTPTPTYTLTPTQTVIPTQTVAPTQAVTEATTSPTETSTTPSEQPAFPIRPSRAPSTLLPNGGRRS